VIPGTVHIVPTFADDVIAAVLAHMNSDHRGDNLTIVRAFGRPDAASAHMVTLDERGGVWSDDSGEQLMIPWSMTISERAEIRREIVLLHDEAVKRNSLP
jgi:hypothetical protein